MRSVWRHLALCVWGVYWLLLFAVMHMPKPPGTRLVEHLGDKVVHACAYFLLAALGGWATWRRERRAGPGWFARWWLLYAVYAAADEILQSVVGRACQIGDWLADVIGATLALLLVFALSYRKRQQHPGKLGDR